MKYLLSLIIALVLTTATLPVSTNAQTATDLLGSILSDLQNASSTDTSISEGFARDGVYGCTGAAYGSVGMQGPGGAHVPVFDDAVHDQIRLLTYKECLLDGLVNSMRETLVSFIIKSVVRWSNQGFNGDPAYVTHLPTHIIERVSDPVAERIITGSETENIAEPFRRDVRVALAKQYSANTRTPENELRCSLSTEQINALAKGDFVGAGGWEAYYTYTSEPSCNPLFAYQSAERRLTDAVGSEQERELTQLQWGNGFRSAEQTQTLDLGTGESVNVRRIVTPGFMIAQHLSQVIGTGLRQSENADEIDEIISALMSNIGTEMLTDVQGLSGLSTAFNGQSSYINRIAQDSATRTRGNLTGAGAEVINHTLEVEQAYDDVRQSSVATLKQTLRQLEAWEQQCWSAIVERAELDLYGEACQTLPSSTTCITPVTVSKIIETDTIGIVVPSDGSISVYGRATNGGSAIDVTANGQGELVGPVRPTVISNGTWATDILNLASLPDGNIAVSVLETLTSGGTHGPITETVQKVSTVSGIELTAPTKRPPLVITASAGARTSSATIASSTARSRSIYTQQIKPILDLLNENIGRSQVAIQVLIQLREALAATVSASGQRYILERLDQLVAARVLHTDAQLRQAQDQIAEIEEAMQQLLDDTSESWEAGWCNPDNWRSVSS